MSKLQNGTEVTWGEKRYFVVVFVSKGDSPIHRALSCGLVAPEDSDTMLVPRFFGDGMAPVSVASYILTEGRPPKLNSPKQQLTGYRFYVAPSNEVKVADRFAYLVSQEKEELARKVLNQQDEYEKQLANMREKVEQEKRLRLRAEEDRNQALEDAKELRVKLHSQKKPADAKELERAQREKVELQAEAQRLTDKLMTLQGAIGASQALRMHAMQVISVFLWLEDKQDLSDEDYDRKMEVLVRRARRVHAVWIRREAKEKQLLVPLKELEENEGLEAVA